MLRITPFFVLFFLTGCDKIMHDRFLSPDSDYKDIKNLVTPIDEEEISNCETLETEPTIIIPEELKQNVSISINENLSLKAILCQTAKQLNIDFQIDPAINSKIIFKATNKSFIDILDDICDTADLRYTIRGNLVKVSKDTPFPKSYNVQFLNFSRDSENKISIATEVSSGAQQANDDDNSQNFDSSVTVKSKNDFWQELEGGIKLILIDDEKQHYSINKQSGVVTACCNSKKHNQIREYLDKIKKSTTTQVLIEAKIIEVHLKNEYRRGIDWNLVTGNKKFAIASEFSKNAVNGIITPDAAGTAFSATYKSSNMDSILKILEEFGSMKTISNPRITAMNNQAAVLKVAENHVYFRLNYEKTFSMADAHKEDISVSSDIKTVPIGLVMFVQPSIDTSNNTISLFLRPTISKLAGTVNDPAVDIAIRSIAKDQRENYVPSKIPVTEVREISSVLKLNDGEIAVLGGFMEVRSSKNKSGIPGIDNIPVVSEVTSSYGIGDDVVELVILIRVKIAKNSKTSRAADIRLQRFVPDPRPF